MESRETDYISIHDKKNKIFLSDRKKFQLLYIIFFTIGLFVSEMILRNKISFLSNFIQHQIDPLCEHKTLWINLGNVESLEAMLTLTCIVYNMFNLSASLSWIFLVTFGIFLNGTLKLFYLSPRPFWVDNTLTPSICAVNYGNPSTSGIISYIMYIGFYKIVQLKKNLCQWVKTSTLILAIIGITLVSISRFAGNAHSINQLLFGYALAYILLYIYYDILEIDYNNHEVIQNLMRNNRYLYIMFAVSFVNLLINVIHYIAGVNQPPQEILDNIQKFCKYNMFNWFDYESYQKSCFMLLSSLAILLIYIEFKFIFNSNFKIFYAFYQNKERMWNNTCCTKTLIRIIICSVSTVIIFRYTFGNVSENFSFFIFMGQLLPSGLLGVYIFIVSRYLMKLLKLTNEYIEEEMEEPISVTNKGSPLRSLEKSV